MAGPRALLRSFLAERFSEGSSLKRLVDDNFEPIRAKVNWQADLEDQADGIVGALVDRGELTELWEVLRRERPAFANQISAIQGAWTAGEDVTERRATALPEIKLSARSSSATGRTEDLWNNLLLSIAARKVVPVIGRDLLWVERDGQSSQVPHFLAKQLAARLGVVPADASVSDPVDAVVRSYYKLEDHDHELPYLELWGLVRSLDDAPPPSVLVKLAQLPFTCFVSTTGDDLLGRAVESVTSQPESVVRVVNSLGSFNDLPKPPSSQQRIVVQLLGRANATSDYAITDADVLEFVHQFQRTNQPERLLNAVRSQHMLFIGAGFSDWLTRFLLRLVRADRLWITKGNRSFFADAAIMRETPLRSFLEHPLTAAGVFEIKDSASFVDELHRRWTDRGGPIRPVA